MFERLADPRLPILLALPIFILCGLGLGNGPLLVLGVGLAILVALGYGMADGIARGLTVERRMRSRAFQGETIDVKLAIGNRSAFPLVRASLTETFPPGEVGRKHIELPGAIEAHRAIDLVYRGHCFKRRGRYRIGPVHIEAWDPLGFFRIRRGFAPGDELVVLPTPVPLETLPFAGRASLFSPRLETGPKTGESLEFYGLREYRPGDPLRRIHWPSTARLGELIAREYEDTVANQVVILMDLARESIAGIGRESTTEYAIRVAAAIASECVRSGHEVAVCGEGQRVLHTPLASGSGHIAALLEELALARALGEAPFHGVVERAAAWIPHGATAIAIFAVQSSSIQAFADAFALLDARRVRVVAILIDDRSFLKLQSTAGGVRESMAEVRAGLWGFGIPSIVVHRGDRLEERLAEDPEEALAHGAIEPETPEAG